MRPKVVVKLLQDQIELFEEMERRQSPLIDHFLQGRLEERESGLEKEKDLARRLSDSLARLKKELRGLTLSELAEELDPEEREALFEVRTRLARSVRELNPVLLRNFRFLQTALWESGSRLETFFPDTPAYDDSGRLEGQARRFGRRSFTY